MAADWLIGSYKLDLIAVYPHFIPRTAGGLSSDGQSWLRARNAFFVHASLSRLFEANPPALTQTKCLTGFRLNLEAGVGRHASSSAPASPPEFWQPTSFGSPSPTTHPQRRDPRHIPLPRYATASQNLYAAYDEFIVASCTRHAKGFQEVRYYGLFSTAKRHRLAQAR